jgi:flagellar hook-basal body complex protein FliE
MLAKGADWQVGLGPEAATGTAAQPAAQGGKGFGSFLTEKVGELSALQSQAAQGAQALASGQATDPTQVVMAVEKARLSMQLASQVRTKATEAINDIFHTQV